MKTNNLFKRVLICVGVLLAFTAIIYLVFKIDNREEPQDHVTEEEILKELSEVNSLTVRDFTIPYSDDNLNKLKEVFDNLTPEQRILFDSVSIDMETKSLVIKSIYNGEELLNKMISNGLTDLDSFNKFIESVIFDPSYVLYSPIELVTTKIGNCYAHTLLTMIFIDKYYPTLDYEIITDELPQGNHIYLKVSNEDKDVIVDLTKDKVLKLP